MQAQPLRRHAREALKFTRLAFTLFWKQSASCVPPHRIDSRTARSIPERFALLSSWETSLLITSMSAGEAMDAECVQLRMIGWQTPTRFGLSSTGGRAIVLYSHALSCLDDDGKIRYAMLSLALTTMGESYMARGRWFRNGSRDMACILCTIASLSLQMK